MHALTEEHVIDILSGLAIVNNLRFKKMFEQLLNCADLGTVNILPIIDQDDKSLVQMQGILDQATRTVCLGSAIFLCCLSIFTKTNGAFAQSVCPA